MKTGKVILAGIDGKTGNAYALHAPPEKPARNDASRRAGLAAAGLLGKLLGAALGAASGPPDTSTQHPRPAASE